MLYDFDPVQAPRTALNGHRAEFGRKQHLRGRRETFCFGHVLKFEHGGGISTLRRDFHRPQARDPSHTGLGVRTFQRNEGLTTQADNGAHSYEVIATDRAGNSAMTSGVFSVNNPADYYASFLAFAPLGLHDLYTKGESVASGLTVLVPLSYARPGLSSDQGNESTHLLICLVGARCQRCDRRAGIERKWKRGVSWM